MKIGNSMYTFTRGYVFQLSTLETVSECQWLLNIYRHTIMINYQSQSSQPCMQEIHTLYDKATCTCTVTPWCMTNISESGDYTCIIIVYSPFKQINFI